MAESIEKKPKIVSSIPSAIVVKKKAQPSRL